MTDDVGLNAVCDDYLDLCPITLIGENASTCHAPHEWTRSNALRAQYGDFTIAVETLNQFAVRAVRLLFRADMGTGQRFIPASIRDITLNSFERSTTLHAKVEKAGSFYQVNIECKETSRNDIYASAMIYVALVTERQAC